MMSAQTDVDNAAAAIATAAKALTDLATKLSGLGIPAPVSTAALVTASGDLATAVTTISAAVDAEAAKLTPAG